MKNEDSFLCLVLILLISNASFKAIKTEESLMLKKINEMYRIKEKEKQIENLEKNLLEEDDEINSLIRGSISEIESLKLEFYKKSKGRLEVNKLNKLSKSKSLSETQEPGSSSPPSQMSSNLTSLVIESGKFDDSSFKFGCSSDFFSFVFRGKTNDLLLTYIQKPIISINNENEFIFFTNKINAINTLTFNGNIRIKNVKQWILILEEDFSEKVENWKTEDVNKNEQIVGSEFTSECSGVKMLGGYGILSSNKISKTFENLPGHENIRVEVNYHFIDSWDGETGFLQADIGTSGNMQYLWTESYSSFVGEKGINVCGGKWPEGKFSSPIDVSFPHKLNSLTLSFGSTCDGDPLDLSYGISLLRIYIK